MAVTAVTEEKFADILQEKLGGSWEQALKIFHNYGILLSFDVANMLWWAVDKGKVDEVLEILERHWDDHLQYQHPDVRGLLADSLGINRTQSTLLRICTDVLELEPAAAQ